MMERKLMKHGAHVTDRIASTGMRAIAQACRHIGNYAGNRASTQAIMLAYNNTDI